MPLKARISGGYTVGQHGTGGVDPVVQHPKQDAPLIKSLGVTETSKTMSNIRSAGSPIAGQASLGMRGTQR